MWVGRKLEHLKTDEQGHIEESVCRALRPPRAWRPSLCPNSATGKEVISVPDF